MSVALSMIPDCGSRLSLKQGRRAQALHKERVGRWQATEHEERVRVFTQTPGAADLLEELGYL